MRNILVVAAGVIAIVAIIPYLRDTLRGKTRPNVITWFTWTLLNVLTAAAAFAAHAVQTGIFASAVAVVTASVCIVGLRDGIKKYTIFDYICQALALVGIVLWKLTNEPSVAITVAIAASFIGTAPTYRHAWRKPHEETWQAFALDGSSAVLAALSVANWNYVSLAYPVYIALSDASLAAVISGRRISRKHTHTTQPISNS
jgi:hypothetical protein